MQKDVSAITTAMMPMLLCLMHGTTFGQNYGIDHPLEGQEIAVNIAQVSADGIAVSVGTANRPKWINHLVSGRNSARVTVGCKPTSPFRRIPSR